MKAPILILKVLLGVLAFCDAGAQNNLLLQLDDGAPFKVLVNERLYNDSAQSEVFLRGISNDTLFIKVELSKGVRYGVTLFLMDKGKPTSGKEFTYLLRREKNRLKPVFMGVREATEIRR